MKSKTTTYQPKNESDDYQPEYMFSMTATDLLVAIANGQIDPVQLAIAQLRNRGADVIDGTDVGFVSHGRYEKVMRKHRVKLQPLEVVEGTYRSNFSVMTQAENATINRVVKAMKDNRLLDALETALLGNDTIHFVCLTKY